MDDRLDAWNLKEEDYPLDGKSEDKLKFLLRYAILAPSGPNSQPWKLRLEGNMISVLADFKRALPNVDPDNRTLYMSNGCFITNLLVAAEHFGFGYDMKYLPDGTEGDRTALIKFEEDGKTKRFPDLFDMIVKRHTNRMPYEARPIEPEKLKAMKKHVNEPGFRLDIVTDENGKSTMSNLLARAHKIQLGNKAFRKELATWIRANNSPEKDGLPGYSFGYTDFESYFGQFIFGTFDMSGSRARVETAYMRASPAVGVLSSEKDDKLNWIKAGIILEKIFLAATKMDIRFDLFSQPVAIPELRKEMAETVNARYPQILIRMGYAKAAKHTPRRPVEELLVH
jgi:hypothetical protein